MGENKTVSLPVAMICAAIAVACFHIAFAVGWSFFILGFLASMVALSGLASTRQAVYFGLVIGLAIYAPHLSFFWTIFGWPAIALWLVLSFWLAIFLVSARAARMRFGYWAWAVIPFLWTGIEYFRSELYFLKFSWLSVGYAFATSKVLPYFGGVGVYGIGFCVMLLVTAAFSWRRIVPMTVCLALLAFVSLSQLIQPSNRIKGTFVRVAGVQMEFPGAPDVTHGLDKALAASPHADIFLLSEYTFHGPIPSFVRKWCAQHQKYLVIGGAENLSDGKFYDTAYVIGPKGDVVFQQAKCVPVQFFNDGLPARQQKVWNSPWGKIGIGVCYDCSYRRVTDELICQGAQALIFPTMDSIAWGEAEHYLHARVGPMRAAEFGIVVVRIASSGISQIVGRDGTVVVQAGFPGQDSLLIGNIGFGPRGWLPIDHWIAPICAGISGLVMIYLAVACLLTPKTRANPTSHVQVPVTKL